MTQFILQSILHASKQLIKHMTFQKTLTLILMTRSPLLNAGDLNSMIRQALFAILALTSPGIAGGDPNKALSATCEIIFEHEIINRPLGFSVSEAERLTAEILATIGTVCYLLGGIAFISLAIQVQRLSTS